MIVIYSSDNFYVVEYPAQHGYELVDKFTRKGCFFCGDTADRFAAGMRDVVALDGATVESVDDYLYGFDVTLDQPVVYH